GALERGYRTGYSDGYQSGWADQLRRAPADYRNKADYRSADRAYIAAYGSLEDYSDGYRQGYEVGYEAGYSRRGFDSSLPSGGVTRRGPAPAGDAARANPDDEEGEESSSAPPTRRGGGAAAVPSGTMLVVELLNRLSTDVSQRGDRFEARVVEPAEFEGATVGGRLAAVERAGKAKGRALLQLDFDQIRMPGAADWAEFSAQVVEVLPSGETGAGEVDEEGGVRGKSTTKEDVAKVGGAAGVGAIIGAIAGGGKGAAIGAIIGGSAGTAGVMTQRGKDIRFEPGQQFRIRSTGPR
ncbi:MAG TPA: hypothetical protein VD968_08120, partial [Pyrinomonadaceae bacterium]|nr:hypothetical protein [Pyrinomonadaceae bacterium]